MLRMAAQIVESVLCAALGLHRADVAGSIVLPDEYSSQNTEVSTGLLVLFLWVKENQNHGIGWHSQLLAKAGRLDAQGKLGKPSQPGKATRKPKGKIVSKGKMGAKGNEGHEGNEGSRMHCKGNYPAYKKGKKRPRKGKKFLLGAEGAEGAEGNFRQIGTEEEEEEEEEGGQ
jgi:hypothetical protein